MNANLHVQLHLYQKKQRRSDSKQVKQNHPFPLHNTENRNTIILTFFFLTLVYGRHNIQWYWNLNFVVTSSVKAKTLKPILHQLRVISKDQIFVRQRNTYENLILQQFLETVATPFFANLKMQFLQLVTHVKTVKRIEFNKKDYLVVQTGDNFITLLFLLS